MIALAVLAALALAVFLVAAPELSRFAAIESAAKRTFMAAGADAGLDNTEAAIAFDAQQLITSEEFVKIRAAGLAGEEAEAQVGEYFVSNSPNLPFSAMTWAELNGFTMGRFAWSSPEETTKTVLQELYRLNASEIIGAEATQAEATAETDAASNFAEKAWGLIKW